jgi:uncharacterized coiled-coil protein SlyX
VDWLGPLKSAFGDGWLFFAAVAIYLVANSGVIPKWLGDRRDEHARERSDAAEDRRSLILNYEREATNQRGWRAEDAERFERHIKALEESRARQEEVIAKLATAVSSSERGNARLRHALNNILHVVINANDLAARRGERPPFATDGLRDLFGLSNDLDEQLRKLLGDVPIPPVPPIEGVC